MTDIVETVGSLEDDQGRKLWTARGQGKDGQEVKGCVFLCHGVNEHVRPYYDEVAR